MSGTWRSLISACVLVTGVSELQSEEINQKHLFSGYLNSQTYKDYLESAFNQGEDPVLKIQCPSLRILESNRHTLVEQPKFVKVGNGYSLASGAWIAHAAMDRCGTRVNRRALLQAKGGKNNEFKPTFLLNGEFRGNLQLERDARRVVFPALAAYGQCDKSDMIRVLDIKAIGPATPKGWSELWVARSCEKVVEMKVNYAATKDGMTISAIKQKIQ